MKKKDAFKGVKHEIPREYETVVILNPEIEEAQLNQFMDKIKDIMLKNKAEFINFSDWGTRKLSFKIKNSSRGKYLVIRFSSNGSFIQELERNLKIMDDCLRFQTVVSAKNTEVVKEEAANVQ